MSPLRIIAAVAAFLSGPAFALLTPTVQVTSVDAQDAVTRQAYVSFSVTGSGAMPTGVVNVVVNGPNGVGGCSTAVQANGLGACEVIYYPHGGAATATATYMGDTNYDSATSAPYDFFNPVMTQVAVTSSPSPSLPGQLVTFTAHVNTYDPADTGSFGPPAGTMDWFVDSGQPCTHVPVVNGVATCAVVLSTNGSHFVSANYNGDGNYGHSEGETTAVVSASPAQMTLTSSANPSSLQQATLFQAVLTGAAGVPTGTIVFKSGGLPIHGCESVALYNGTAGCSTGTLSPGDHAIRAEYGGDANYPAGVATLTQTVGSTPLPPPATAAKTHDLNGDGTSDILWRGADGSLSAWLMNGVDIVGRSQVLGAAAGSVFFTGDFDGDGKVDVVRQLPDGTTTMLLMNGVDIIQAMVLRGPTPEHLLGVGDFDGDHKADLLWRQGDGTLGVWLMNGTTVSSNGTVSAARCNCEPVPATPFYPPLVAPPPVVIADFNGDGRDDILELQYAGMNQAAMIIMDGTTATSTTQLMTSWSTGWYAVRAADLNGDGNADIIWVHSTGATSAWLMNGSTILQRGPLLPAGSTWRIAATGDFNGDGKSDLMFRNSVDGSVGRWFMDGLTALQKNTLLPAGTPWSPALALDVSGDNTTDMLWQATDGSVGLWTMSNPNLPLVPPRRTLLGPNAMWNLVP